MILKNLTGILDYCIKAKVKGIMCFGFGLTLREGNREYFYSMLDKHFPGMKEKYIKTFGNSYICKSPNNKLWKPEDVFKYLTEFEDYTKQLSLFDL